MEHLFNTGPTKVRYQVLAVACSLAVLTYVQRQGFIAATPYIKQDLGLDDGHMGYLAAIWLVAYGLFQVPGGLIGDRIGSRHLLTFLVLGWSVTLAVVGVTVFLPAGGWLPLLALLLLRFFFGMFQAGGFPGLARVLADWMPMQQRGFAQGMNWTFSRLGGFVAPLLVVWLITRVFNGWAVPCWLLAGLGLVWCGFFWPWFRNRPQEMSQVNEAERDLIAGLQSVDCNLSIENQNTDVAPHSAVCNLQSATPLWRRLLTSRSVWGLCLMYGCVGFSGNFITSLLPLYLRDHRRLSDEQTAWLSGLPLACGVASCLLGGVLSDWLIRCTGSRKWGRRLVGGTALVLAGGACLSAIWSVDVWMIGLCVSAWFFFNDATMGPAWAACADVGERDAGTLSGAMNMTGALFGAVGMALAGKLLRAGDYELMFILFACSYVLAALCWLAIDVTKSLADKL